MNILLVDDDAMITEFVSYKLKEKGFNVDQTSNGWDALNRLSKNKYDLLITDLMMPDISGLTVISLLKNYAFEKLPVIIITSLDQSTMVLSSMGLGVIDYFVKPLNIDKLIERVSKLSKDTAS